MPEISCYDMHLYCDGRKRTDAAEVSNADDCPTYRWSDPAKFAGPDRADCVEQARKKGWIFKKDGRTLCPKCSGKKKRNTTKGRGIAGFAEDVERAAKE